MMDLLPDLCDQHGDALQVAEPLFHDYGGKPLFYGEAVTLSCFEDNSLVRELVASGHALDPLGHVQPCRAGQHWSWDGVRFDWLHPIEPLLGYRVALVRDRDRVNVLEFRFTAFDLFNDVQNAEQHVLRLDI